MKKIIIFFLTTLLIACQNHQEKNEIKKQVISNDAKQDTNEEKLIGVDTSYISTIVEKPLYIAQCMEPFMAAIFFENKIRLIFPEKTDSILNVKKLIISNTDFEGSYISVNKLNVRLSIKNKPCIHPGSGEIWEKIITFVVDNQEFKGCLKKIN